MNEFTKVIKNKINDKGIINKGITKKKSQIVIHSKLIMVN